MKEQLRLMASQWLQGLKLMQLDLQIRKIPNNRSNQLINLKGRKWLFPLFLVS